MTNNAIQSVDRALEILKLLATHGPMTASALAEKTGLDQSTASRQLKSLMKAGFVRKPTFHSFEVDYGLLRFAGTAIRSFPLVNRAASACEHICQDDCLGAAVCVLDKGDLIYVARRDPGVQNATIQLVDHSDWPLHRSSMGLVLSHERGQDYFTTTIGPTLLDDAGIDISPRALFDRVDRQLREKGFFNWGECTDYNFNMASPFPTEDRTAALAIFSHERSLSAKIQQLLEKTISNFFTHE